MSIVHCFHEKKEPVGAFTTTILPGPAGLGHAAADAHATACSRTSTSVSTAAAAAAVAVAAGAGVRACRVMVVMVTAVTRARASGSGQETPRRSMQLRRMPVEPATGEGVHGARRWPRDGRVVPTVLATSAAPQGHQRPTFQCVSRTKLNAD